VSLNYIALSGKLAQAGEIRYTASGKPVLEFHLNLSDAEDTPQIRVIGQRSQALELSEQLQRGVSVIVEGQLIQRKVEESGHHRKLPEIRMDHLILST
jgi:single-stranded DNA-binding protein